MFRELRILTPQICMKSKKKTRVERRIQLQLINP